MIRVCATRATAWLVLIGALALAGCGPTSYRYHARGTLALPSGETDAVLYWRGDEGRLWYGRAYAESDSGAVLRVCGHVPYVFVAGNDDSLRLDSGSGDAVVRELAAGGELAVVDPARRVRSGTLCGVIGADGVPATTRSLAPGVRPEVIFLCTNTRRPARYPGAGVYVFDAVSKTAQDAGTDPDPCRAR